MKQKFFIISIAVSAITGFVVAAAVCVVFFFYYKPAQLAEKPPVVKEEPAPTPTPKKDDFPSTPPPVEESEVTSATLETIYKGFFEEGSRCRKTYNELFGDKDGVYSPSSPCRINLSFDRDGNAEKSIEIRRYDNTAKQWRVAEKSVWKSKVSAEQFKTLAKSIVSNDAFKSWMEGTMITVSNSSVTVKYTNGLRSPMSNVDEKTTVFLAMMDAFKRLENALNWEKIQ